MPFHAAAPNRQGSGSAPASSRQGLGRITPSAVRIGAMLVAGLFALPWGAAAAIASPADPPPGPAAAVGEGIAPKDVPVVVVPVRLPISGNRDTQVSGTVIRHLDKLLARPGERGVLVLRFEGADEPGAGTSDFARSLALAMFLADQRLTGQGLVQLADFARTAHALQLAGIGEDRHASAVIAAVFQTLEAFNEDSGNVTFGDGAYNATHGISPR